MDYKVEYDRWLKKFNSEEEIKSDLLGLDEKEIEDRFYKTLEFGTGGLRGIMGVGINRMNIYTVRKATQGLALEIIDKGREYVNRGVVIAYDSRNNSAIFAMECAKVLSANKIKVYLFEDLRPTPELSFAVRYLNCVRGIVITASHNPKEYNGYKVYGEDGGQIPPDVANVIINYINNTDIFDDIKIEDNPCYVSVGEEVDRAYIDAVKEQSLLIKIPKNLKIVYTPIHGSGNKLVRSVLDKIGAKNVFVVPEQELPDGNFPTVISPNPENSEAFTIAIEYAKKQNADVILGTDPDSDRIGVVVRKTDGTFAVLNGNQTGVLLCEFILRKMQERGELPTDGAIIKTIVTTQMIKIVADNYNIETVDVLTGFKFIGEKIKEFEKQGKYDKFIFGLEESYGYLKGTYARDKDAVVAAMLITELVADLKSQGKTLYDGLIELYEKYGYFKEELKTITLAGIDGAEKIADIMRGYRKNPPAKICGFNVLAIKDYTKGIDNLPKADVMKFIFENGWLAIRPSGTEPKIKVYFGINTDSEEETNMFINKLKQLELQ